MYACMFCVDACRHRDNLMLHNNKYILILILTTIIVALHTCVGRPNESGARIC